MAVQPFSGLHVLQPDYCPTFNGVTLFGRCPWLRSNNPIAIGILNIGKASDRLLAAARAIGYIMGM